MDHFNEYSKYYNLLYKDKDYDSEVRYLIEVFNALNIRKGRLLDIGCGTGKHASLLDKKGFNVHGVDVSDTMLELAHRDFGDRVTFLKGDIRDLNLNKRFNLITSLFHVMSYQTTNEDVESALKSVYDHLEPGGYFIFDCWYGPGVINDLPSVRIKRMNDDEIEIIRIAEPEIDYKRSVVDVNFQILINNLNNNQLTKLEEKHPMRYFFKNEIDFFAKKVNFKISGFYSWLTFNEPDDKDWYVLYVLEK